MCLGIDPLAAHKDVNTEEDQALNFIMLHLTIKHAGNDVTVFQYVLAKFCPLSDQWYVNATDFVVEKYKERYCSKQECIDQWPLIKENIIEDFSLE